MSSGLAPGRGTLDTSGLASVTLVGLGMFSTLFLGTVLAVFLTLGAVRGDAERGLLQPLVVRPLSRAELLLGRFAGAGSVCAAYVVILYAAVIVIVHAAGGSWPDRVLGPGAALAGGIVILVALSLLGSVLLSAVANGIAMFMVFGAGLVAGLMNTIGNALNSPTRPDDRARHLTCAPVRGAVPGGPARAGGGSDRLQRPAGQPRPIRLGAARRGRS